MKHNTKTKVAMLLGGALASFGSLIPMATYAAPANCSQTDASGNCLKATATVTAVINPHITIDAASGNSVTGDAGGVLDTSISATITSNSKYTISVKTATSETSMKAEGVSEGIPANASVAAGTNAWAIKSMGSDNTTAGAYVKITAADTVLYTSPGGSVSGVTTTFPVGISTSNSITAGSYSVNLVITATNA